MDGNAEFTEPRRSRKRRLILPLIVAAVAGVVWLVRTLLPGLPQISEADLAAAQSRWQAHEVRDYDLTVVLGGRQTGELKTTVRHGEPTSMTRNGTPIKEPRAWRPWTVPGLFETLETDFDNAAHPAEKFGSADVRVVLRAEFDPQYGFPRRYLQQVYGRLDDLTWTVTEFTPK
jgi:hypothetical protein